MVLLVQDVRGRWIHLFPVIVLGLAGFGYRWLQVQGEIWLELLCTAAFLGIIVGAAWGIMKLRHPGRRFLNAQLGSGDLAMFLAVACWLDPLGFALYFVSGLIIVLMGVLLWMALGKWREESTIPLAGLLAGYLLVFAPSYWYMSETIRGLLYAGY